MKPNWTMAGWVEQSSARSIALPWSAWAIGDVARAERLALASADR